jgi:adhesin HecA-like repeat protein
MAPADATRAGVDQELREAMLTGRLVDWRTGDAATDNPDHGAGWGAERTVAAGLLAELLTSAKGPRRPRALRLAGAHIVGRLNLEATELVCPLLLRGCSFTEEVVLAEAQAPAVRLPGCHLPKLFAPQLTTRGNLSLNEGFTATGEVNLVGANIGGKLSLRGATLTNPGGLALSAERLIVDVDMVCREGFKTTGEVNLLGAHIGGNLDLDRATLDNPDGLALNADRLTVGQDMACRAAFTAKGEVRLLGAHIGGLLDCERAKLTNPNGTALSADRLVVDGGLSLRGAEVVGEVWLAGARIGRELTCTGARFTSPSGLVLSAGRLVVDGDLFLRRVEVAGEVRLLGAHIGGNLDLDRATLDNPDGLALHLQDAYVGALLLRPATAPSRVNLNQTKVGVLHDDRATWPNKLHLVGFAYDALAEHPAVRAQERLAWLRSDPDGYSPQPYEQLAAIYRRGGRDQDARTVAIAKQRARRRTLGLAGRLWSLLLDALVGYGYRTWLAGVWLMGFWLVGWAVFDYAHAHEELVLARPDETHPGFQAAIYSLDTLLPVVDLRQQAVWIPRAGAQWWAWASILAGWVLTTAVVAAFTGLLKRE